MHKRATAQLAVTVHYFDYRCGGRPGDAERDCSQWHQGDVLHGRSDRADPHRGVMAFLRDQRMVSVANIPTFAEAGGLATTRRSAAASIGQRVSSTAS